MTDKHFKRRQYLVNPGFQLRLMAYMAVAVLLALAVMYVSNDLYFDSLIEQGEEIGLTRDHPYYEFIEAQRARLDFMYFIVTAVVFTGLMIFGLFMSHRIAGPIYRIESYLQKVAAGEEKMAPVRLRDGDFFPEIAGIVNSVIDHFSEESRQKTDESHENGAGKPD